MLFRIDEEPTRNTVSWENVFKSPPTSIEYSSMGTALFIDKTPLTLDSKKTLNVFDPVRNFLMRADLSTAGVLRFHTRTVKGGFASPDLKDEEFYKEVISRWGKSIREVNERWENHPLPALSTEYMLYFLAEDFGYSPQQAAESTLSGNFLKGLGFRATEVHHIKPGPDGYVSATFRRPVSAS